MVWHLLAGWVWEFFAADWVNGFDMRAEVPMKAASTDSSNHTGLSTRNRRQHVPLHIPLVQLVAVVEAAAHSFQVVCLPRTLVACPAVVEAEAHSFQVVRMPRTLVACPPVVEALVAAAVWGTWSKPADVLVLCLCKGPLGCQPLEE